MIHRLTRIGTSLALVVMAYWVYALVAVPLIEPPAAVAEELEIANEPRDPPQRPIERYRRMLAKYFQPGDWERAGTPKILGSDRAKLLIDQYQTRPDHVVELYPCTLIFFTQQRGSS